MGRQELRLCLGGRGLGRWTREGLAAGPFWIDVSNEISPKASWQEIEGAVGGWWVVGGGSGGEGGRVVIEDSGGRGGMPSRVCGIRIRQ
jgi:hypothetical protein